MEPRETAPRCAGCGAELPVGAQVCAHCGQRVGDPPSRSPRGLIRYSAKSSIWVTPVVISAVAAVAYRIIEGRGLTQTYATFVGLPLLIGVLSACLIRPQSGLGATLKIATIILCVVAPVLGEGAVCLLMAAPLFYVVVVLGYLLVTAVARLFGPRGRGGMMAVALLPFLLAELTSSPHGIRHPRTMTVRNDRFIAAPPEAVWNTLLKGNLVSSRFPLFFRLGFPLPTRLERRPDGATRLAFDPGSEPWPGTNVIVSRQIIDSPGRRLTFVIEADGTKLSRWLTFLQTRFEVERCTGGSRLRQVTTFRQRMQPGLYWNPLECFAVGQMHRYALSNVQRLAEAHPR